MKTLNQIINFKKNGPDNFLKQQHFVIYIKSHITKSLNDSIDHIIFQTYRIGSGSANWMISILTFNTAMNRLCLLIG